MRNIIALKVAAKTGSHILCLRIDIRTLVVSFKGKRTKSFLFWTILDKFGPWGYCIFKFKLFAIIKYNTKLLTASKEVYLTLPR